MYKSFEKYKKIVIFFKIKQTEPLNVIYCCKNNMLEACFTYFGPSEFMTKLIFYIFSTFELEITIKKN